MSSLSDTEFNKLVDLAENRLKKLKILGKEDSIKYKIEYKEKKIILTEYNQLNSDNIDIPDFITDIKAQIQDQGLKHNNRPYLTIKIGKQVTSLNGLLKKYKGAVVTIIGGSDKLKDLSELANDCQLELISFELDKSVKPIKMIRQFKGQQIGQIRFNGLDMSELKSIEFAFFHTIIKNAIDLQNIKADNLENLQYAFCNQIIPEIKLFKTLAKNVNLHNCFIGQRAKKVQFSTEFSSKVSICEQMFDGCEFIESIDFGGLDFSTVESTYGMFRYCIRLTTIGGNIDFRNVYLATEMFCRCMSLTQINLELLGFRRLIYIVQMFKECVNLYRVHFGKNECTIIDANYAFRFCRNLKEIQCVQPLRIDGTAQYMFADNQKLRIIDTSKIIDSEQNLSDTQNLVSSSGIRELTLNFDIVIGIQDNKHCMTINKCLDLETLNFNGKVVIGKQAKQEFIQYNPNLREINFYGGLYINKNNMYTFIQMCDNIKIIRQRNKIDINKVITHFTETNHKIKIVNSYKQKDMYVYEIDYC